jgi:DNA ligase-associated metallophosphoesterase
MMQTVKHVWGGEEFLLHPSKALYWPRHAMLVIADLHVGKVNHFRKAGMAAPEAVNQNNFQRLTALLEQFPARHILFLGDLTHSNWNKGWDEFAALLNTWPHYNFSLVAGNHDILPSSTYSTANLTVYRDEMIVPPFRLAHYPPDQNDTEYFTISGHRHPGIVMRGKGRQRLRLPCFYFQEETAVLPAFGSFTGLSIIKPHQQEQVFPVVDDKVLTV